MTASGGDVARDLVAQVLEHHLDRVARRPKTMVGTRARTRSAASATACFKVLARMPSSAFTTGGL